MVWLNLIIAIVALSLIKCC